MRTLVDEIDSAVIRLFAREILWKRKKSTFTKKTCFAFEPIDAIMTLLVTLFLSLSLILYYYTYPFTIYLSLSHFLSHKPTLFHTHIHTHTHAHTHARAHTQSFTMYLSLSHTLTHSFCHTKPTDTTTISHTHTLILSLTHIHIHFSSLKHTPIYPQKEKSGLHKYLSTISLFDILPVTENCVRKQNRSFFAYRL